MINIKINTNSQLYIDRVSKCKLIRYEGFKHNEKHKGYEFYNKYEKLKLGVQLCDFLNTDFHSFNEMKNFVLLYSPCTIAELGNVSISNFYKDDEFDNLVNNLISSTADRLSDIQNYFKSDIEYIYNLNDLEELNGLTPSKRLYILRERKEQLHISKILEDEKVEIQFGNYGDFTQVSVTSENDAQEIANHVQEDRLLPYHYICKNIIPTLAMELFELTAVDNIEIKKCKNCGKLFVPENRSDELYCSNIIENGKTCKEVGPFRFKQKLMEENNDLKVYRNVYQKLLLRTRRNPTNSEYENDFIEFKKKNAELKEKISNGKLTQEKYMEWLNKQ